MPWYNGDYPPSYKNQPLALREKAVEIANALLEEGTEEGIAIATGLKQARMYFKNKEKTEKKDTVKKEEEPEKKFWDKCYTGGNVSLNIGSYGSYIEITPLLGYNLTDYWSIGVSASYKYFSGNNSAWGISYRTHVYGGSVFYHHFHLQNILL